MYRFVRSIGEYFSTLPVIFRTVLACAGFACCGIVRYRNQYSLVNFSLQEPKTGAWLVFLPNRCTSCRCRGTQVEEERKEAEVIKERVAKDEAAVATRQEQVTPLMYNKTMPLAKVQQ